MIPFTTIIPLEAQKATLPKEESSKTLGQIRSSPSEFSSRHIDYRSYSSLYLEGAFVDTKKKKKKSLSLLNIKSNMELHSTTNRQMSLQASDLVRIKQNLQDLSK